MSSIGERMRARMEQVSLSQSEVGRQMVAAGFPYWNQITASRTITGKRHLRLDEAYHLAKILCTTVDHLAGATSEDPGASPAARRVIAQAIESLTELQERL